MSVPALPSRITRVTVLRRSALVTREAELELATGVPERVRLTGLPLTVALALLLAAASANAQQVEVTPFVGYQLGGQLTRTSLGHLERVDIADHPCFGLTLGYAVSRDSLLELTYSRQPTRLALAPGEESPAVHVQYLLLGGSYHWGEGARVDPYVQLSLGTAHLDLEGRGGDTRFATAIGGGARLFLSRRFAVRVDGRLLSTYTPFHGEVFCRPSSCYGYVESAWLSQLALSAGLIALF